LINISKWVEFWKLGTAQKSVEGTKLLPAINALLSKKKKDISLFWTVQGEKQGYNSYVPVSDESRLQNLLQKIVEADLIKTIPDSHFDAEVIQLFMDWSGDKDIWRKFDERERKQREINRKTAETRERNNAIRREAQRKEWEERERISKMSFEEKQVKWRQGDTAIRYLTIPHNYDFNSILRIRNGKVETSKGISVDTTEATRLWSLIQRFHENEMEFHRDIVRDADNNKWTINSYQNNILTAGCHTIQYTEMAEVARQLGLVG
jgi:hypothetical protein